MSIPASVQCSVRAMPNLLLLLCTHTEQILMKFVRGHYHEHILWLYFFPKLKHKQGSWIPDKIRIDVTAVLPRCHRANEFTNFTAQTTVDVRVDSQFKDFTNFIWKILLQISVICWTIMQYLSIPFNSRYGHLLYSRYGHLLSSIRSLRLFACHSNADTEHIYNGCRTNAAVEASYGLQLSY